MVERRKLRLIKDEVARRVGCQVCGERSPEVLDFHHVDPSSKDRNVSRALSYSSPTFFREIQKCAVVCANDHRRINKGTIDVSLDPVPLPLILSVFAEFDQPL